MIPDRRGELAGRLLTFAAGLVVLFFLAAVSVDAFAALRWLAGLLPR